ncbi:protein tolA, putative [Perkinsus marinus ATCC 50983]|uniref:Protein tolA, putative n=1 Tax=Perkinsus marinus (strain ATCC 50983 / TXsc) TaxID=423536 RepID=C5LYN9_PERM5|nr:protein tolA, putative [Perkinsus marinus ATCC 50983]EEQ98277.1 protein tolA, putative [Perkinsus marinus ATCC 50983]|eukprot:XP_002765560.1 protein tolA, putative [Perkinsus marinus ATCC 50983]
MAGRKLRNKTDDGESSGDEMVAPPAPGAAAASVSSADVFEWHSPSEGALASPSAPEGGRQVQRDKPRRVRGNKAHERPQDFEKLDTQLEQERQATEDLFASLPSVPINDDEDINTGGVYHALSRKEKKKNAKNAAAPASKSQSNSKPQLPVVAASDTMMLQLLAKHQAAQREEAEKKKKIEEDERKRVEEEEAELRRQQEEEKARLEREEQWRRRREEAQKRQDESKRREEEEARQRQVEAARKAEEDRRRQAVEEAIIDRQLSVISASRSNSAKQQCITSMKHFLQRLSRQYDIHVDTGSWKKRLEAEGEGAAPTWNWCDQLLVFRPLDSRGSKVLPTPMSSAMDTDNCEVRITHVMLCTNYVGLIVGDVQVDGEESRERLAAGVIVCGRSGGLPGQSPVGTYRAIDVVRAALRRNKDVLDSDWTMQGVKELRDLDVTPQSSLTNVDHKHEDVYVQELSKPMIIAAPRETITVKQRAPQPRSGSTSGLVVPPWRRGTSATDEQQQLPWASGAAAGLHRQQSGREMLTMSNALLRTGEKREYTDFQTCLDKEGIRDTSRLERKRPLGFDNN